jgi:hypothetical protein
MKRCILLAVSVYLFGCSQDDPAPVDRTVHLAGFVTTLKGTPVASYWKDGIYTALTSDEFYSNVSSLSVDGSSVFIGGSRQIQNSQTASLYWRDGKETTLNGVFGSPMVISHNDDLYGLWMEAGAGWVLHKHGISLPLLDTAYHFGPMALTVSGNDIYTSGYSSGPALPPNYSPPQNAQCWKNGQLIFRENEISNALSIFVHQNDIYMAGHLYNPAQQRGRACYWKNGQRIDLTDEKVIAVARSIFVTDTKVYAAGMINDQSVYWKDGTAIFLTTGGTNSMANSIFVQGDDVHVAGYENGYPAYWKNGVKQNISNQDKPGQIKFVVAGPN